MSGPRVVFQHQLQMRRKTRKPPSVPRRPDLSITEILAWADAFHQRTGRWPKRDSGRIPESLDDAWSNVRDSLQKGNRGLPKGSSLAQLLAEHRGVRNIADLPRLTVQQIVAWADAHHNRTGEWPRAESEPILDAPGETWTGVDCSLTVGRRGLRGGSSLARLLAKHRGVRNKRDLPHLQVAQILKWADAHHNRTGQWPKKESGAIVDAPGEIWTDVDQVLRVGLRGLPGGSSLARLLAKHRGRRNHLALPPLTPALILKWADAHHRHTGKWPLRNSGPITDARGETWMAVENALSKSLRGLAGGSSLARFLSEHRGVRNIMALPHLNTELILKRADAHHSRTGQWPTRTSGPITESHGELWMAVESALRGGRRGLSGRSTLTRFLKQHGRV